MGENLKIKPISEGARIAGLLFIRDNFSEQSRYPGDDDYWTQFERQVGKIPSIKEACFEYHLGGFDPRTIAEVLLNEIPRFKTDSQTGNLDKQNREQMINRVAGALFEHYPQTYQDRIRRTQKIH